MLKAVDPESTWQSKDEVGRCMRFHQEVIKQILKSIRQNFSLYDLYGKVTEEAIEFCKFHKRKNEFKSLCYLMKTHAEEAIKCDENNCNLANPVKIGNDEAFQKLYGVRLNVVKVALEFECWQDAYMTIESIFEMNQARIKSKLVSLKRDVKFVLYEHLSKIFWKSKYYLMQAAASKSLIAALPANNQDKTLKQTLHNKLFLSAVITPLIKSIHNYRQVGTEQRQSVAAYSQQQFAQVSKIFSNDKAVLTRETLLESISAENYKKEASSLVIEIYKIMISKDEGDEVQTGKKFHELIQTLSSNAELAVYVPQLKYSYMMNTLIKFNGSLNTEKLAAIFPFATKPEINQAILNGNIDGLFNIQISAQDGTFSLLKNIKQEIISTQKQIEERQKTIEELKQKSSKLEDRIKLGDQRHLTVEEQQAELERQAKEQSDKDKIAQQKRQEELEHDMRENLKRRKIAGVLIEKEEKIQTFVASICSTLRLKGI